MAVSRLQPRKTGQRGFVLIGLVALLVMGALYFLVGQIRAASMQRDQDLATLQALAQAKEALIAYAVTVDLHLAGSKRPGDLPCPDLNNDGHKEGSCGNVAGTTFQAGRLGRLPWLDLDLPDLRDTSGERLWYAVSNSFKENTRIPVLNSDTTGTITVRDANGNIIFDGSAANGVVAVIIAPGPPLTRQDGLQQDRSAANINDPRHYLDNIAVGGSIVAAEDNADFDETGTLTNGFFSGPVRDAGGTVIANDRIMVITRDEIMAALEKRVVAEVRNCLTNYAADAANGGRYPWAASLATSAVTPAGTAYQDTANTLFGRVPGSMWNTGGDGSAGCGGITGTNPAMLCIWAAVPNCNITNTWFGNWREQVFYALADAYKPGTGAPACGSTGTCLTIDSVANKQVAVFLAGRKIGTQTRADKTDITQYLDGENNNGDTVFVTQPSSATFNDRVLFR